MIATPDQHFRFDPGPHLWEVCDRCNYDRHICPGCGDNLRHDDRNLDGTPHTCYTP